MSEEQRLGWSRRHDACIDCGTTSIPHSGHGRCRRCYEARAGAKSRQIRKDAVPNAATPVEPLTKSDLERMYFKEMLSHGEIAERLRCTRQYVGKMFKRYGIDTRSKSAARRLAQKKGRVVVRREGRFASFVLGDGAIRADFFNVPSPEMAYVLGVIYTDGCLHGSNKALDIGQKKPELLEKCRELMGSRGRIRSVTNNGIKDSFYMLTIGVTQEWDQLLGWGLHPRKSLTVRFPRHLPKEMWCHFIRGCWDGDGSIYNARRPFSQATASIVTGSEGFALDLREILSELVKPPGGYHRRLMRKTGNWNFTLRWHGPSIVPLYHFLYDGVPPGEYLERKHARFCAVANMYEGVAPPPQKKTSGRSDSVPRSLSWPEKRNTGTCFVCGKALRPGSHYYDHFKSHKNARDRPI